MAIDSMIDHTAALQPMGGRAANGSSAAVASTQQDHIVVGVDFGTTYSGVATAHSARPDDIEIIKAWPGSNGITSDKVPSEIAYDSIAVLEPGQPPPPPPRTRWGFEFRPEEPRVRCMKLFLDRQQQLPHWVSPLDTAAQLRRGGRSVVDAVADYLAALRAHALAMLERRYGADALRATPVDFVLTVPAVWSDAAKNATLLAAERAGMGHRHSLKLVAEPEAAAVYALKAARPGGLAVGDHYVVCDAGGGTVDLIAYRITQIDPLRVDESATGTGGLCGSAFLNCRFEDHVRERIGDERFHVLREKKPRSWMMGLRHFEEVVKRNFVAGEHGEVNIPFPGLADDEAVGLECGFLVMTAEQVAAIFAPVVRRVIELVEGQVSAVQLGGERVSGIVLVGGFGQSNHLYNELSRHFDGTSQPTSHAQPSGKSVRESRPSIDVLQPMHAWTAVVRGAVIRGLEGSAVERRRSRYHYGTSYATVFDHTHHSSSKPYWSPLWERWMVADRMRWHVAKGTPLSAFQPVSFRYTRNFRPGQSRVVQDELLACEPDAPPAARDASLIDVCTLTTDLGAVPKALFTRLATSKGAPFDNLDFELLMKVDGAGLVFELRVNGVKYGSVQADFH